ncbi:MAG: hypothetical protein M3Z05_19655 [Gemmatimonadota bacterium]|nr:hypothetical protein [Gemmatimonadota bacterium]
MIDAIGSLDLNPIKFKLMDQDDGEGWSREKAEAVDVEYRRFLMLNHLHASHAPAIVPSQDVDTFWHYHILDTMKYARDCNAIFGRFLHHFPYFGLRGEADARKLEESTTATRAMYEEAFGVPAPMSKGADCQSAGCGSVACAPGTCNSYMEPEVRPELASV